VEEIAGLDHGIVPLVGLPFFRISPIFSIALAVRVDKITGISHWLPCFHR
jgi:hypothetical protein